MNKKLDNKLAKQEINQTSEKKGSATTSLVASPGSRQKRSIVAFRDSAIERIKKIDIAFGGKSFKEFKFDVSKGTSLKGLLLRVSRRTGRKDFYLSFGSMESLLTTQLEPSQISDVKMLKEYAWSFQKLTKTKKVIG